MKRILTHPDNVHLIRGAVERDIGRLGYKIQTDSCMPKYGPNKRIKLPDGRFVDRDAFSLKCGCVTYGPEDLTWLMWAGVIEERLEPLYYIIDEPLSYASIAFRAFSMYSPATVEPRAVFKVSSA